MESIPKKKKKPTKKPGEALFIKPCQTMPVNTPSEGMLIKRCHTLPTKKTAGAMLLKPCQTVSERSNKKRRVTPPEVEEEKEEHEEEVAEIKFKQGDHVDVKALLSSKSRNFLVTSKGGEVVPIAVLDGKYVIVCCFYVPFDIDDPVTASCQSIEALYNELTFKGIADRVRFVVVVKIAPGFGKAEFDSFFSRLSVNCLAIPFADSKSRDKICKSFGLLTKVDDDSESPCLVVHPNEKVLQFQPDFLEQYGARSFPFSKEHFDDIRRQEKIIRNRICSTDSPIFLEELLQCDYLSRIANENEYVPTSSLGDTVVALYLCYNGSIMDKLQAIHKKCIKKRLKFEVILVPLPFYNHYETPSFRDRMKQDALKHSISSSWWMFPFDDKVYRTLWRLFYQFCEDQLLILPHGQCPGDLRGREIATRYGISAYPFTKETVVNKEVRKLRSFTLQDLLKNTELGTDLENKNVLLYFDSFKCDLDRGYLYSNLMLYYHEIKAKYADSEVVFVSLHPNLGLDNSRIAAMMWPILPLEMCASVIKRITPTRWPGIVAFGSDGKILSRSAQSHLPISTSSRSLFEDTLASEVAAVVETQIM
ncbi:hypothetical protein KSS87_001125 [Heliosperma pusillum]|nr:hypothetical protein KSS87_001125 [Heliosperma pusillum]